ESQPDTCTCAAIRDDGLTANGSLDAASARRPKWRMGWDSNPRTACTVAGFQDRCLKPLGHPSGPAGAPRAAAGGVLYDGGRGASRGWGRGDARAAAVAMVVARAASDNPSLLAGR